MYLVTKKVPESLQKDAEKLFVTKQHSDKHGGPHALSEDTQKETAKSHRLSLCIHKPAL